MNEAKSIFVEGVDRARSDLGGSVKIQCTLFARYRLEKDNEIISRDVKHFATKYFRVFKTNDLDAVFEKSNYPDTRNRMREYEDGPSGQSLDAILHLKIEIIKLNPMRAGCHMLYLKMSQTRRHASIHRKWTINICYSQYLQDYTLKKPS